MSWAQTSVAAAALIACSNHSANGPAATDRVTPSTERAAAEPSSTRSPVDSAETPAVAGSAERPCPPNTAVREQDRDVWCVKPNGDEHGPATRWQVMGETSTRLDYEARDGQIAGFVFHRVTSGGSTSVRVGEQHGSRKIGEHHLYMNGVLAETTTYSAQGEPIEMRSYYPNGRPAGRVELRAGELDAITLHGPSVRWYDNGQKASEGEYRDGEPHALESWKYWDPEGRQVDKTAFEAHWKAQQARADTAWERGSGR